MSPTTILTRLERCVADALPKGMRTAWWLIKITIPVSFAVMLLDYFGALALMARYTGPLFGWFGLPGVSAIVLVTSIFTNIYSVVAVLAMLHLPVREGIILGTMCLISHNFVIETAVMKKTGSGSFRMIVVRLAASFVAAWLLNLVMPGSFSSGDVAAPAHNETLLMALQNWGISIGTTILKILILVNVLLILQRMLEEFGLISAIEKPMAPLMKLFGLPANTTLSWLVANIIGLAYGSALMIDQVEKGRMSRDDADLLNHHVSISHSQLEDPLLFATLGYTVHWLIWPRVLIAMAAVWLRKAEKSIQLRKLPEQLQN